jgi:hypothetical protein
VVGDVRNDTSTGVNEAVKRRAQTAHTNAWREGNSKRRYASQALQWRAAAVKDPAIWRC